MGGPSGASSTRNHTEPSPMLSAAAADTLTVPATLAPATGNVMATVGGVVSGAKPGPPPPSTPTAMSAWISAWLSARL